MITPPPELLSHSHFARYFRTWQKNRVSIVFVPLAEICRQMGYLEEARQICTEGLQHHPDSVTGRLTLARVLLELERPEEVALLAEKIMQDFPGNREAEGILRRLKPEKKSTAVATWETCTMARILAAQGEKAAALAVLEKILTQDPSHQRARTLKEELCPGTS